MVIRPPSEGRKHRKSDDEYKPVTLHHDESNWLVSYADMMTLLFMFFVLLYSMSKIDVAQFEIVRKEVAKHFGGKVKDNPAVKKLVVEVEKAIDEAGLKDVKIVATDGKLQLRFQGAILFESGSAALKPEMQPLVDKVVDLVKQQALVEEVRVEGHSDNEPINSRFYPSNWELSSARASTLIRSFLAGGFEPEQLAAEGYADSRPLVPNVDQAGNPIRENQAQNRRVVVNITFGQDPMAARNAMVSKQFAMKPDRSGRTVSEGGIDPLEESEYEGMSPVERKRAELKAAQIRLKEAEKAAKERLEVARMQERIRELESKARAKERQVFGKAKDETMNLQQGMDALRKTAKPKNIRKPASKKKPGKPQVLPKKRTPSSATNRKAKTTRRPATKSSTSKK